MTRTKYSPEIMREGIEEMLQRNFSLKTYQSPELNQAIGRSIQEKVAEGFNWGTIIYPVFVPFFVSDDPEIKKNRQQFIEEHGGEENIEFYLIRRTGEIIVLTK
jgi:hypothetical protein